MATLVIAAGSGAAIAGCGGGAAPTVPSLAGGQAGHPRGGAQAPTVAQSDRDMIAFARCIRSNGVQMSDPFHRPGHAGLTVDLPTQDAATRPAYHACIHFLHAIIAAKQSAAAGRVSADLPALTRYAECMRGHDIAMLDPSGQGAVNLGSVPGITADFGRYSPQFRGADAACRHILPSGVHDDGTGP